MNKLKGKFYKGIFFESERQFKKLKEAIEQNDNDRFIMVT